MTGHTRSAIAQLDVMDTHATITGVAVPPAAARRASDHLRSLHERWSRFDEASEISRLNRAGGRPVRVADETLTCVALAVVGWQMSAGRFDPTILDTEVVAGYDCTFAAIGDDPDSGSAQDGPPATGRVPGCRGITIDSTAGTIALPPGVHLDLGGIAKGYAADLLVAHLRAEGAVGACVNIGGDVRVWGRPADRDTWEIAVADPVDERRTIATLTTTDGAVATSSRIRRSWHRHGAKVHHLVDPATGRSTWTGLRSATAIASEGWCAEVAAKAAFLAGADGAASALASFGARALLVDDGGALLRIDADQLPTRVAEMTS